MQSLVGRGGAGYRGYHGLQGTGAVFNTPAYSWAPFRYQGLAAREWDSEFSGPAEVRTLWSGPTPRIVEAFQTRGERAGFAEARRWGALYVSGARLYVENRAAHEEELARRVAALTALLARTNNPETAIRLQFLQARLNEVRSASRRAETPPQAVRDRPEVATRPIVPHWVSFTALALSAIGVALGYRAQMRTRA